MQILRVIHMQQHDSESQKMQLIGLSLKRKQELCFNINGVERIQKHHVVEADNKEKFDKQKAKSLSKVNKETPLLGCKCTVSKTKQFAIRIEVTLSNFNYCPLMWLS